MKTRLSRLLLLGAALALASVCAVSATAQVVVPVVDPAPDIAAVKLPGGIPVAAIISLGATVVVAGVKFLFDKFFMKIPGPVIPFIALAVSYALDWVSHLSFGTDSNWAVALGAGFAAIGLNQIKKQLTPSS